MKFIAVCIDDGRYRAINGLDENFVDTRRSVFLALKDRRKEILERLVELGVKP